MSGKLSEKDRYFLLDEMFPKVDGLLESYPKVENFYVNAAFVFDTSCLLTPYEVSSSGLTNLADILRLLAREKRLFMPERVLREFVRRRSDKLRDIYKQLSEMDRLTVPTVPGVRMFEGEPEYTAMVKAVEKIDAAVKEYHEHLDKLVVKARGWSGDDPVSRLYAEVFAQNAIIKISPDRRVSIADEFEKRKAQRTCPGWRDAENTEKGDGGIGDFLVWMNILEVGKATDVVLVTNERKDDWVISAVRAKGEKEALYPRFELVEEFRRTTGHRFAIVNLGRFLELHNARSTTVIEVQRATRDEEVTPTSETRIPTLQTSRAVWTVLKRLHKIISDHVNGLHENQVIAYPGLYADINAVCDSWVMALGPGPEWDEDVAVFRQIEKILRDISHLNWAILKGRPMGRHATEKLSQTLLVRCSEFVRTYYLLTNASKDSDDASDEVIF